MHSLRTAGSKATWILAGAVGAALGAQAQQASQQPEQQQSQQPQQQQSQQRSEQQRLESQQAREESRQSGDSSEIDLESWSEMEGAVVHAEELLEGDVTNGLNPIGSISDLVLSADGSRVEYVLFEVPYPYGFYGNEDGFTSFEAVDIFRDAGLDFEVRLPVDVQPQTPEELRLTASEAERRLVSRLIGERLYFSEEASRRIEDLLIDRETGEVLHYVIEADPDAIFAADLRTVPAEQVSIDDEGQIQATIQLAGLDDVQEYDSDLL